MGMYSEHQLYCGLCGGYEFGCLVVGVGQGDEIIVCDTCVGFIDAAREQAENTAYLANGLAKIQKVVDEQAEDEGLWFFAETAPEAYLMKELRRLHAVIEKVTKNVVKNKKTPGRNQGK